MMNVPGRFAIGILSSLDAPWRPQHKAFLVGLLLWLDVSSKLRITATIFGCALCQLFFLLYLLPRPTVAKDLVGELGPDPIDIDELPHGNQGSASQQLQKVLRIISHEGDLHELSNQDMQRLGMHVSGPSTMSPITELNTSASLAVCGVVVYRRHGRRPDPCIPKRFISRLESSCRSPSCERIFNPFRMPGYLAISWCLSSLLWW
jgi:hypothetical protein